MNSYDFDNQVRRQKEMARQAAEIYPHISHLRPGGIRLTYRRWLAGIGGRMIALGYRLQGEFDHLATAPGVTDGLGLNRNEPCLEC